MTSKTETTRTITLPTGTLLSDQVKGVKYDFDWADLTDAQVLDCVKHSLKQRVGDAAAGKSEGPDAEKAVTEKVRRIKEGEDAPTSGARFSPLEKECVNMFVAIYLGGKMPAGGVTATIALDGQADR